MSRVTAGRLVTGAVGVLLLGLFAALGGWVHGGVPAVDVWLVHSVVSLRSPSGDAVVEALNLVLAPALAVVAAAGLAVAAVWAAVHRRWPVVVARCVWLASFVLVWRGVQAVKQVVDRPRPPASRALESAGGFSYPSGHVVSVATVGLLVVAACWCVGRHRAVAVAGAAVATLTAGFDRVFLGVHYPTDVLGAVLGVTGTGLVVAAAAGRGVWCRRCR